jgi:hypothetical protein
MAHPGLGIGSRHHCGCRAADAAAVAGAGAAVAGDRDRRRPNDRRAGGSGIPLTASGSIQRVGGIGRGRTGGSGERRGGGRGRGGRTAVGGWSGRHRRGRGDAAGPSQRGSQHLVCQRSNLISRSLRAGHRAWRRVGRWVGGGHVGEAVMENCAQDTRTDCNLTELVVWVADLYTREYTAQSRSLACRPPLYGSHGLGGKRQDPKLGSGGQPLDTSHHESWWNQWLHRGLLFGVSVSFLANDQSKKPDKLCEGSISLELGALSHWADSPLWSPYDALGSAPNIAVQKTSQPEEGKPAAARFRLAIPSSSSSPSSPVSQLWQAHLFSRDQACHCHI